MAESIGEASWKAFTKKQKLELDDAALVKALAKFDKTDIAKPEPRMQALDEVIEQGKKQLSALIKRKKDLGDKPFSEAKGKVDDLIKEAEQLLKEARSALESSKSEDEEADSPTLMTSKMVPLLRELRKGEITMHALIATAGRSTAVLVMRRAISMSRRKMLAEALDAKGGAKYIVGEVLLEKQALTFVVQGPAAGLAKRVRQALLEQTELRLKVRVRGEGGDQDEDGEEGDQGEQGTEGIPGIPGIAGTPPLTPVAQDETQAIAPSEAELAYRELERRLAGPLQEALSARHPEATKLGALSGFASVKSAAGDFAAASKALGMVETLLNAGLSIAKPETVDPSAAFKARLLAMAPTIKKASTDPGPHAAQVKELVARASAAATKRDFEQGHLALDEIETLLQGSAPGRPDTLAEGATAASGDGLATWQKVRTEALQTLRGVAAEIDAERHPESDAALIEIRAVIANLTESPITLAQVAELERYLGEDDVVDEVCELAEDFRTPLFTALAQLRAQMSA